VAVDAPGGEQGVHIHHPPALADLDGQRIDGDECVGPASNTPGAERLHGASRALAISLTWLYGQPADAQRLDQLLHPPRRHPQQVRVAPHRDQCLLGAATPLEQPVREVRPCLQLRDRPLDAARPGVPLPRPVAVAGVQSLVGVRRPAQT
jgi:hypothetical protein